MSLSYTYDGSALTTGIAPSSLRAAQRADLGQASQGGFDLEDPTAAHDIVGHQFVTIEESACSQPRLFTGWTAARKIGRDLKLGQFVGDDPRAFDVGLVDLNAALRFVGLSGSTAKRPAETWTQRLTWLLAQPAFTMFAADTGYVMSLAVERDMDATSYLGYTVDDVLRDLCERVGDRLNYFLFWDAAANAGAGAVSLFLNYQGAATNDAGLSISNDPTDIDLDTVFPPDTEAKLSREPDEVYSEVRVDWANGSVVVRRPSTEAAYVRRTGRISRPYIKTKARALQYAEAFLDRHDQETDRITCTIIVPAAKAGLVTAGQRITVKFTHLPGYENGASMRVAQCIARPLNDVAAFYALDLELLFPKPAALGPGGSGGQFQYAGDDSTAVDANAVVTLAATPGPGSLMLALYSVRDAQGTSPTLSGWTKLGGPWFASGTTAYHQHVWYKSAGESESATVTVVAGASVGKHLVVYEIPGGVIDEYAVLEDQYGGTSAVAVTPTAGASGYIISSSIFRVGDSYAGASSPTDAGTEIYDTMISGPSGFSPLMAVNHRTLTNASGSYNGGAALDSGTVDWTAITIAVGIAADETEDLGADQTQTVEATTPPTADDDTTQGYIPGQTWIDSSTTPPTVYVLTDATEGAAVWVLVSAGVTDHGALSGLGDDDHTQYVKDSEFGAKGRILVGTGAGTFDDLVVGADGLVLTAASGEATGLAWAAPAPPPVVIVVDGGGEAIAAGAAVSIPLTTSGAFTSWTIVADQTGSIEFDLQVDGYADYPPTSGDSIVGAAPPTLTADVKATDSTLTGWSPTFTAGDVLRVVVESAATVEHVTLTLERT